MPFPDSEHNDLALVPKLYQKSLFERLKEKNFGIKADYDLDFYGPEVVEFDPTTACNLGCPECISGSLLGNGGFSREAIESLLNSFVQLKVKAVVLIGGGEPMMHPMIDEIIQFLHANDIHIGITTNGLFIEKNLHSIANKVSWLRVSVDAANSDTYRAVRPDKQGKSLFDNLVEQMKLLGSYPNRHCRFGYSMLLLSRFSVNNNIEFTNAEEIFDAAKLAKEIGCDYFEVKPTFDSHHFHIEQPKELMETAKKLLDKAKAELQDDSFSILTATNLFDIIECKPTEQPKEYTSCPVTNLRTLVSPSGVFPCPYFRGVLEKSYGNPNHESLIDIWNGNQKKVVQNNLDPSTDCKFHCIRHNTNTELLKIHRAVSTESNTELPLSDDYNRFF